MNNKLEEKLLNDLLSVLVFNTCSVSDLILNRNHRFTERNSSLWVLGSSLTRGSFLFPGSPE